MARGSGQESGGPAVAVRQRQGGFMLVEVMVALAIVSLAFAYAFPTLSESLGRMRSDQRAAEALSIARSTLDRVGHDIALQAGRSAGTAGDGYDWNVDIAPYDGIAVSPASGIAGYVVEVSVDWRDQGRARQVRLGTVRLGPPRGGA